MTGTSISSAGLDPSRRRLLYRAWHRGLRELDLLIGQFADARLAGMSAAELAEFERLLDAPDPDMLVWLTSDTPAPPGHSTATLRAIKIFHTHKSALHK